MPDYLEPSGQALRPPADDMSFSEYVSTNKQAILSVLKSKHPNNFQGDYTLEEAAELRAPFEWPIASDSQCASGIGGADKGFLLIHGLTDSPYLMRSMAKSIRGEYPCAVIRAIILPGHGTIPGDSVDTEVMTHENWIKAATYGFRSFDDPTLGVESVYAVTFSTGAPVVVNHLFEITQDKQQFDSQYKDGIAEPKLKGAVFLSAAIKAATRGAIFSPILRHIWPWLNKHNEQDAVRYESFSTHAGAEFYLLTKDMHGDSFQFQRPLFVVISADDATVSPGDALKYFCNADTKNKQMIWYESNANTKKKLADYKVNHECLQNITVRVAEDVATDYYKQFAHTALSVDPDDPHYGVTGAYKQCKGYFDMDEPANADFTECVNAKLPDYVIGEPRKLEDSEFKRRGIYNPDYAFMEARILAFIDSIE